MPFNFILHLPNNDRNILLHHMSINLNKISPLSIAFIISYNVKLNTKIPLLEIKLKQNFRMKCNLNFINKNTQNNLWQYFMFE